MGYATRSLQSRLTLNTVLILTVVLALTCCGLFIARNRDLEQQFDASMLDRAQILLDEITSRATMGNDPISANQLNPYRLTGHLVQLRNANGQPVESSANLAGRSLPYSDETQQALTRATQVFETVDGPVAHELLGGSGGLRLLTLRNDVENGPFILQIAASNRTLRDSLGRFHFLVLVIAGLGLIIAAGLTWIATHRAVAPLNEIAAITDRLGADNIAHRFDTSGSTVNVARLLAGLNSMLDRLSESFKSQDRFISDVAHELKTPLALLLSEAQVLGQSERTPIEYARFLATIQDEVRAMSQIVESLLMLARAEGGTQVSMAEIPINEFVMAAVERTAHLASQAEVSIVPHLAMPSDELGTLTVNADQGLMTLAVANLLRNAIRYAPAESAIDLVVNSDRVTAVIRIRDQGKGISAEHLSRVFDRFYRVPESDSTFQGVGLGLTIVKGIVNLHRGSIEVANHPDGGCEFTLKLPRMQATTA